MRAASVDRVDDTGIELVVRGPDRVVDVLFDDRRIWSFWLRRDTEPVRRGGARRAIAWPERMQRFLDGRAAVTIREHVRGVDLFHGELAFGDREERIAFVNKRGVEISLDKAGRFSPTFSVRSKDHLVPLLDAMETVIAAIADEGVAAFPAYGTLLGAVREGTFLGHDSDADLGYVSRWTTPVDVARESFQLQRALVRRGFATHRYSGAAFRIDVEEGDGSVRGLDLFGGFLDEGRLYLMGEVGTDFRPEWLEPFTTCTLMGREFAVPARPEKLLEAMYGPSWRVPDPAFKFETPPATVNRLNGWFRGSSAQQIRWERALLKQPRRAPKGGPSGLARKVHASAEPGTMVLDVGAGRARDSLWLARRGRTVTAYDFVPRGALGALAAAERAGLPLDVRRLNLNDLRSVLGEGARAARLERPRAILARHAFDAVNEAGRDGLARFATMALRGGGRLYADVWTGEGEGAFGVRPMAVEDLAALVERHGGAVIEADVLAPGAPGNKRNRAIGRLVAEWA